MQGVLFCNDTKCRRQISSGSAWVTSCCHVFCHEDGKAIIENGRICPACSMSLNKKHGIISFEPNPDKAYRSMILLGQRPDIVMDICQKAISGWMYQYSNELQYRELMLQRSERKIADLKQFCEQLETEWQKANKAMKSELSSRDSELAALKKQYNEVSSLLSSKSRQCKKLEATCHRLTLASTAPKMDGAGDSRSETEFCLGRIQSSTGHQRTMSPTVRFSSPMKHPSDFSRSALFPAHSPDIGSTDYYRRLFSL